MLDIDIFAVAVHVRPLGSNTVRLTVPKALHFRVADRTILCDPGRHRVVAGALVLDADHRPWAVVEPPQSAAAYSPVRQGHQTWSLR